MKNVPTHISNLKSKVIKLDIGELETTPVGLSKLSNVVKTGVVKKDVYNAKIKSFFLFIQKHNGHINKMKKTKTKIHITVIRCKAAITPELKLKEGQLQN